MNSILYNPFDIYTERKLITVGSIITIVFSYIAFLVYIRFDGLVDMHFSDHIVPLQPLLDNTINIITCSIFLFVLGKYINRKTRFIDILAVSIVARFPFYPLLLLNINNFLKNSTEGIIENSKPELIHQISPSSLVIILLFALLAIGALIWYMILLYRGFKTATNSKGNKPIALFVITIFIVELISKLAIHFINY